MKLVIENLDNFIRGKDPRHSLDVGYFHEMPKMVEDLKEELNWDQDIQYDVELSNHPSVNSYVKSEEDPVLIISTGFEPGHGLSSTHYNIITHCDIIINPFKKTISGQFFVVDYDPDGDETEYKYDKKSLDNLDMIYLHDEIRTALKYLLKKSRIEIE